jgi:hypothetical protein
MAYVTLEELRAEGITSSDYPNDTYLTGRIALAQAFIEKLTGRFFESKAAYTLQLDGTGHNTLFLPIPPVNGVDAITEVTVSDEVLDSEYYQYPLRELPDDRFTPRLIHLSGLNISITGEFGFVESDKSTPPLVKDLCKRIAVWTLSPIGDKSASKNTNIIEEELGDYRYRLSELAVRGGLFGDSRIDNLIAMFRKKRVLAI